MVPLCRGCRLSLPEALWPDPPPELARYCPQCAALRLAAERWVPANSERDWARIDSDLTYFRFGDVFSVRDELTEVPEKMRDHVGNVRLEYLREAHPEDFDDSSRPPPDLAALLAQVSALQPPPDAVEALWDGDTRGWYLYLQAVWSYGGTEFLICLDGGGDGRLFSGEAPPWDEAEVAQQFGERLTKELGIPFYFPSPNWPELSCPGWNNRELGQPCENCGIPLLQRAELPWRGLCFHCHLTLQPPSPPCQPSPPRPPAPILRVQDYYRIVVLTGAGISTASGLPTYRSSPPPDLTTLEQIRVAARTAVPNPAHLALARLEQTVRARGGTFLLITQNVDGLHYLAGSERVAELHGNVHQVRCTNPECAMTAAAEDYRPPDEPHPENPRCRHCGHPIRPDVVLIGEPIRGELEHLIKRRLRECDLFLAIGTSGTVAPASHYAYSARFAGARTALLNLEFDIDSIKGYDSCYYGRAEDVLPHLFGSEPVAQFLAVVDLAGLQERNVIFGCSQADADLFRFGVHAQHHGVEVLHRQDGHFLLHGASLQALEKVLDCYHQTEEVRFGYRCLGERQGLRCDATMTRPVTVTRSYRAVYQAYTVLSRADRQALIAELHRGVAQAPLDRLADLPLDSPQRQEWKFEVDEEIRLRCLFCASDDIHDECYAGGHFGTAAECGCGAWLAFQRAPARPATADRSGAGQAAT